MGESDAARAANIAQYEHRDARHGAPHLTHATVGAVFGRIVKNALARVGPQPRVLDLGAGDGSASRLWVEAGARLTAVDSSGEQLRRLQQRFPVATTVEADGLEFLGTQKATFDIVSHISMLHHIPDYMGLLKASARAVAKGGALVTFQDPLRYDRLPRSHFFAAQALYVPWRISQGDVLGGVKRRLRRARGIYLEHDVDDQGEYHFHRNGVDEEAITAQLKEDFTEVEVTVYFSSHARLSQWIGERLKVRSTFGILATGRR